MRRVCVALLVVTIGLIAAGWAPDGSERSEPRPRRADFLLYVSNQSFRVPRMRIVVRIDRVRVVDSDFDVGNQHNWVLHPLRLRRGSHVLHATAPEQGVSLTRRFSLPARRWAVLNYWNYAGEPERFTFQISRRPPLFA